MDPKQTVQDVSAHMDIRHDGDAPGAISPIASPPVPIAAMGTSVPDPMTKTDDVFATDQTKPLDKPIPVSGMCNCFGN
ncbi:hypothetical protein M427DRAFT_135919 [Gonapodya prolifera JEL478]|uniref:Uncharacterized protein n=1 Tax=Gonapodya prolifera (strain JEL478) TaxID=1344416 RepID=A0A139AC21_GONPJ|nr:hypothetical protein M427DRAFT_135919 [Gonapodya prolifera JEL478]|eukprot:KXS14307.1 hypothetical protein M427DRAFT_135919 [Gonapodya prolifera JEL478]